MDDDFDNGMGLPDDEIGVSIDDIADTGTGGIENDVEPGMAGAGGTRSSGGARARTVRAPKAAAPAKKSSKPKTVKKKAPKKAAKKAAKKKAKAAKKPARKAARKSGKKAARRKK
jgi:hypothetical protein